MPRDRSVSPPRAISPSLLGLAACLAFLFAAMLASPTTSRAATITVDTAEDHPILTAPDGCSLRRAILDAHLTGNLHCTKQPDGSQRITIELPFSVELTLAGPGEDDNHVGDLDIGDLSNAQIPEPDVRIVGTGSQPSTIRQTTDDRVLHLHAGSLELENVVVTGGDATSGGGILARGATELVLTRAAVVDNSASLHGGGIVTLVAGGQGVRLMIAGSVVARNEAGGRGGGIRAEDNALVLVESSAVSDNHSGSDAAGISGHGGAQITLVNSTVSGNHAQGGSGGGIAMSSSSSSLSLRHSTVTANRAAEEGGGVELSRTPVEVSGAIVAGNTAAERGAECLTSATTITSLGHNLIGSLADCDYTAAAGDQLGVADPGLGPLADNGGPTQTHALLPQSPAIDAAGIECPATDQRGISRPQGTACDIGAFELEQDPPAAEDSLELPARLAVGRAQIRNRRLVLGGRLARGAAGERLTVRFRARGREIRLRPRVQDNGRFQLRRNLRGPQRRARAGRLIVRFDGTQRLRRATAQVRAARVGSRLSLNRGQPRLRGNRLTVAGTVRRGARGRVFVRVEFNRPSGEPAAATARARVNRRGRFRARLNVPNAVRQGGAFVSVRHTGRARLHGQVVGRGVGG